VMILEIEGINGQRVLDEEKGLHLLRFPSNKD
jgi:hypothetical protein